MSEPRPLPPFTWATVLLHHPRERGTGHAGGGTALPLPLHSATFRYDRAICHPLPDVRYVIFNESTKLERDDDDDTCPLEGQDDFVPLRKVKYDYLTPRQLPCGNRPSTTVWSSPNDIDYTADELLALARDQRLAREADRRRPESPPTPPHSPLDDDV